MQNAVEMICTIQNESVCDDCQIKPIIDDYWKNWRTDENRCNKCMQKMWRDMKNTTNVVKRFRKSLELKKYSVKFILKIEFNLIFSVCVHFGISSKCDIAHFTTIIGTLKQPLDY